MNKEELQKLGEKIKANQATKEEVELFFREMNSALSDIRSILVSKKKKQ